MHEGVTPSSTSALKDPLVVLSGRVESETTSSFMWGGDVLITDGSKLETLFAIQASLMVKTLKDRRYTWHVKSLQATTIGCW